MDDIMLKENSHGFITTEQHCYAWVIFMFCFAVLGHFQDWLIIVIEAVGNSLLIATTHNVLCAILAEAIFKTCEEWIE